jgi:hypothetical protein
VPSSWDAHGVSIQSWIERSIERRLKDTRFGVRGAAAPVPAVWDDPLVNQVIKMDIATFLIGERHSVRNTAAMLGMAPDEASTIFLSTQVLDEARHFEAFARRMADLGVSPEERDGLMARYTVPAIQKLFDLIDEQIDKRCYVGAAIGQNLILEGMAFPVYRYESRYWSYFDPGLSQIIRGAFADEVQHTGYGEAYLKMAVRSDVSQRNLISSLLRQFHTVMHEMFRSLIRHYVGLYQAAADEHMEQLGAIEIFTNRRMADTSEEEQMTTLLAEIEEEYARRAVAIGVALD